MIPQINYIGSREPQTKELAERTHSLDVICQMDAAKFKSRCSIILSSLSHHARILSVRQRWLPQHTYHHVAVKYWSICFLQVLYSSHHCHRASHGADLVIRVELLSTVPCPMDNASQYLTMFRYLIMPFVFARAAIRYWQLRDYWKWDSNNYTSTQLSS